MKTVSAEKIVGEYTETVEEVKLAKITLSKYKNKHTLALACCTLFYFQ